MSPDNPGDEIITKGNVAHLQGLGQWGLFRLFECIGTASGGWRQMRKGSPRDYDAETGCLEQPAQKSQLGEPHECYPLYRIGRTQENHQLLHKDSGWPNRAAGQIGGIASSASNLGRRPDAAVARSHGSDPFQCLDLRHTEALCGERSE